MNLSEKKSLNAKYLLRGYPPTMELLFLCKFCIEEAKSRIVMGAGNRMVADKAAKLATQMIAQMPLTRICAFLQANHTHALRAATSISFQKDVSKKTLVKAIRSEMQRIMTSLTGMSIS